MNYKELIQKLSDRTGNSQTDTKKILGKTVSVITSQLADGEGVSIPHLGTFGTRMTNERKIYNPHFDDFIIVPEKRVVDFTQAADLKEKIRFQVSSDE
ncbi:MAG: HU family DNA-binding protein [Balneolaceae bacterium]|nr:MAG: HU family DNA-binding protein [Balneolaceae bacterium]